MRSVQERIWLSACSKGRGHEDQCSDREEQVLREAGKAERHQPGAHKMHRSKRNEKGEAHLAGDREGHRRVHIEKQSLHYQTEDWANPRPFLPLCLDPVVENKEYFLKILLGKHHLDSVINRICGPCRSFNCYQTSLGDFASCMRFDKTPKSPKMIRKIKTTGIRGGSVHLYWLCK